MNTIIIADDHPLTLSGTQHFVARLGYEVKAVCSNGASALNSINLHRPTVALIDVNMPGMDGLDVLAEVAEKKLSTRIVLLTMHNEYDIYKRANELGVFGYVLKEQANQELQPCLEAVFAGKHWVSPNLTNWGTNDYIKSENNELTRVENKIIELIRAQKSTKQIAELLFLSDKTVEKHRGRIIEKLGLPKEKNALLRWVMMQPEGSL